jgi:hypothetical protein
MVSPMPPKHPSSLAPIRHSSFDNIRHSYFVICSAPINLQHHRIVVPNL